MRFTKALTVPVAILAIGTATAGQNGESDPALEAAPSGNVDHDDEGTCDSRIGRGGYLADLNDRDNHCPHYIQNVRASRGPGLRGYRVEHYARTHPGNYNHTRRTHEAQVC